MPTRYGRPVWETPQPPSKHGTNRWSATVLKHGRISTVIYYAPTIFKFAGPSSASVAIPAGVGVDIVNGALTVVAM
jgi:hypothetical protein